MTNTKEKIGVGIITFNRQKSLRALLDSLEPAKDLIDSLIVINDGASCNEVELSFGTWMNNEKNIGVGRSKNKALKYLYAEECTHFFLLEDDITIKNISVFQKYIDASKVTGIQHFNFGLREDFNKRKRHYSENIRLIVDYEGLQIAFFSILNGVFSYFSRSCLDTAGYLDEQFFNAVEHVEHLYRISQIGMHPSFWHFADLADAEKYIENELWVKEQSTICSSSNFFSTVREGRLLFQKIHGMDILDIPVEKNKIIIKQLKRIRAKFSKLESQTTKNSLI